MDILKILKELLASLLPEGVTLTDKQLTTLESALKKEVGEHTVPNDVYAKKTKELSATESKNTELTAELSELKAVKDELAAEKKAHADTKTTHEAEKSLSERTALAEKKLLEAGCNPAAVRLIVKELQLDKLKADGSNFEELHKSVREANAAFYGEVKQNGADVGTPPAGQQGVTQPKNLTDALRQHYEKKG